MDFDSPTAAQKAVAALKTSGVQAQMAKVRDLVFQLFSQDLCTHDRFGEKKKKTRANSHIFQTCKQFCFPFVLCRTNQLPSPHKCAACTKFHQRAACPTGFSLCQSNKWEENASFRRLSYCVIAKMAAITFTAKCIRSARPLLAHHAQSLSFSPLSEIGLVNHR